MRHAVAVLATIFLGRLLLSNTAITRNGVETVAEITSISTSTGHREYGKTVDSYRGYFSYMVDGRSYSGSRPLSSPEKSSFILTYNSRNPYDFYIGKKGGAMGFQSAGQALTLFGGYGLLLVLLVIFEVNSPRQWDARKRRLRQQRAS